MKESEDPEITGRRNTLKKIALGSTAGLLGLFDSPKARAEKYETPAYQKGAAPVTITKVRAITTKAGSGSNLVIVKVETSEPGLYGIGCATFTQRAAVVVPAVDLYLDQFCRGRNVDDIEDLWMSAYVSSYWRNGPVLSNALSGLDQALWDIKGKRAKMPVYQLLGGRSRINVDTYIHASGNSNEAVAASVQRFMDQGWRHVRIQLGGYGGTGSAYGNAVPDFQAAGYGGRASYSDQAAYLRSVPKMFEHVRKVCGEKVELLHDMHEQVEPIQAINMIKQLEPYRPFFIEDPFSPENMLWFRKLREATPVPTAMGELFNNINEFRDYMVDQLFDFIRCHISQIGGITPGMKIAKLGEWFNVRTAWHGPGDTSPVGHQANNHIDLAVYNFGIQEGQIFNTRVQEVFPGTPIIKNGYFVVTEEPGLGIDINETEAAKYPITHNGMGTLRKNDGTIIKP